MFIHCPEKDLLVNINKSFAKLKIPKWENSRLITDRKELFNLHLPDLNEKSVLNFLNRVQLSGERAKAGKLIDELLSRIPSSRASTAACDIGPPSAVTTAPAMLRTALKAGVVARTINTSPGSRASIAASGVSAHRARPR